MQTAVLSTYVAVYSFISVCTSVRYYDNLRLDVGSSFFGLHLQRIRVKFVYEGHRVKFKVTGAKSAKKIPISAM